MSNIFDLFKKIETAPQGPVSFIIVGLGNIGKQYEMTRHNAGFLAIDRIAEKYGTKIDRVKFHATVGECTIGGKRVLLMKPTTLMNLSGLAVGEAASFYKIPPENVLVLHDEISFDPGIIRIRRKGSAGGHNGLKSLISSLASDEFPRIKIGVGKKPNPQYDLADWVLGKMPEADMKAMSARFDDIAAAAEMIVKGDIDGAMSKFSK
jgi:PTH1 family peptidyl-tRNA hydrolase